MTRARRASGWGRLGAFLFVAGAACNALVGIDEPSVVDQEHCAENKDCSNKSYVCVLGLCAQPCAEDGDCGPGLRCLKSGDGSTGACVGGSSVACRDEGDCPGVPICSKGECRNDCIDDPSSCLADQTCGPDGACYGTNASHDPTAASGGAGGSGQAGRGGGGNGAGGSGTGGTAQTAGASGAGETAGEAGTPAGGEGGASEAKPECTNEGAVRCAGHAATGREVCDKGRWQLMDTCADGELCDTSSEPPGQCKAVPDDCLGRSPGEPFCAGSVRSVCGPDLVSVDQTPCDSQQLCTLGTGPDCAACLPNEHRCLDQTLQGCKPDNTGFETLSECTDAPCNADAGACTTYACLKGQKRCNKDALEQCKSDQSGWDLVMNCGAGLCDSAALDCDTCVHGVKRCTGMSSFATCNSDGQGETPASCLDPTPVCAGAGVCVECQQSTDCTAMGPCYTPSCNSGTGKCDQSFNGVHSTCNGSGLCDAGGNCVECVTSDDCAPKDDCHPGKCVSGACQWPAAPPATKCAFSGGKYCDAGGACVGCTDVGQCSGGDTCNPPICDSTTEKCSTSHASKNTPCGTNNTNFCDGSGACVECTTASQCGADECYNPTCTTGTCGETPASANGSCGGGSKRCDGSGHCVTCFGTGQAQCNSGQVCHSNSCATAEHTVGNAAVDTGTFNVFMNSLLVCQLPALQYDATLVSFGVVGDAAVNGRMVLYKDSGGAPSGAPVAQSSGQNFTFTQGAVIEPLPSSASVTLTANTTYWVGVTTSADTAIRRNASGTQTPCKTWGQSFTAAFGSAQTGTNTTVLADMYIRVTDTD